MTGIQKIIKYLALAFAFFIIISIIYGLVFMTTSISYIFETDNKVSNKNLDNVETLIDNQSISALDIDIQSLNLIIKEGSTFRVDTNNKYIKTKKINNKFIITEKDHNIINSKSNTNLIIYLPKNQILDEVEIATGIGNVEIDNIQTQKLYLSLAAGKTEIKNLNILNKTEIDGGFGEIIINNGCLNNLYLDMGVGNIKLTSLIKGKSEIDAGVGNIELNLLSNDYKLQVDTGIGNTTFNGNNVIDGKVYGNGNNIINIDGGAGSIKVNTK